MCSAVAVAAAARCRVAPASASSVAVRVHHAVSVSLLVAAQLRSVSASAAEVGDAVEAVAHTESDAVDAHARVAVSDAAQRYVLSVICR